MNDIIGGLLIGTLFGAALYLGGLAEPDKIIGTLRLKDFHAMRVIALFVAIGMVGIWVLENFGVTNYSIKPAAMISVAIGGAILGIGFGMTGYCPGTGLACAAAGRVDAAVSVLGMLVGAFVFILLYDKIAAPLDKIANLGKKTLPEITNIHRSVWTLLLAGVIFMTLILTAKPKKNKPAQGQQKQI